MHHLDGRDAVFVHHVSVACTHTGCNQYRFSRDTVRNHLLFYTNSLRVGALVFVTGIVTSFYNDEIGFANSPC